MIRTGVVCLWLAAVLLCGSAQGAGRIELTAVPAAVRVHQQGAAAGSAEARVACARNEYESLQVVVTAASGNLENVQAEVTELKSAEGQLLGPGCITLYRVAYVPVRHSAPRATEPPGLVPDPLVPFVNPYTGEPVHPPRWRNNQLDGARFGGGNFTLWEGRHQPIWVDVFVPPETPAGEFTGAVRVRAAGVAPVDIPLTLTVWDFTLPPGPTHENHFGGFERAAGHLGLKTDSEAFHTIEDRYVASMAAHRINPPLPRRLRPPVAEDGSVAFNESLDERFTAFVHKHHVTNIDVPRAPFRDVLGADREKALKFYRTWYAYVEKKGWAGRAYLYMLDEPNTPEAYEHVRKLAALVHQAEPRLRRLVVEQPYTQNPDWTDLNGSINIWCPLFGFVHEPSIQRVIENGDEVWSYSALVQTAPPYHPEYESVKGDTPPFWQIDFPAMSYRIAPWLNRRYGITGLLYWSTVYWGSPKRDPWLDPGFRVRWNGDGFLFYPGDAAGIEGPITTVRLKNLRDGMEDYEYFVLLQERGGAEAVDAFVHDAIPTWGTWDQDPYRLLERRRQMAAEILRR